MPHLASIATPAAALFLALTAALPAGAEISAECRASFEGDRLSVIVPNGPGGGYDTYARAMAPVIAETTGARVSVENLPGAGGLIASRRSPTNGSSLWSRHMTSSIRSLKESWGPKRMKSCV
jgi:tripartite-type tricarboxylate transporter receptor subunit TctC